MVAPPEPGELPLEYPSQPVVQSLQLPRPSVPLLRCDPREDDTGAQVVGLRVEYDEATPTDLPLLGRVGPGQDHSAAAESQFVLSVEPRVVLGLHALEPP